MYWAVRTWPNPTLRMFHTFASSHQPASPRVPFRTGCIWILRMYGAVRTWPNPTLRMFHTFASPPQPAALGSPLGWAARPIPMLIVIVKLAIPSSLSSKAVAAMSYHYLSSSTDRNRCQYGRCRQKLLLGCPTTTCATLRVGLLVNVL